jgi:hypothetical protein
VAGFQTFARGRISAFANSDPLSAPQPRAADLGSWLLPDDSGHPVHEKDFDATICGASGNRTSTRLRFHYRR